MIKKVFKGTFFVAVIFLFVFLFMPMCKLSVSYGDEANNSDNYIAELRQSYVDGKFEKGLEVGIDYNSLHLESEELSLFKTNLSSALKEILNYEKNYITQIYNESEDKKYSPIEDIVFGEIEQGEDYFYFGITFSSIEAYKYYYSDLISEINDGFLITSLKVKMVSPFNIVVDELNTTKSNFYLKKIYSACKGLSIEDSIKTNYKPKFMFDFVSGRSNYWSDCEGLYVDNAGYYHYIWGTSKEFAEMNLHLNYANKGWWYLLGLTIPLACMGVSIVIILLNDKNKKRK